jgi:hypothetical protein
MICYLKRSLKVSKFYANKEKREKLGALSLKVFGRKGTWHKAVLAGTPVEQVEAALLKASEEIDKRLEAAKQKLAADEPKNEN